MKNHFLDHQLLEALKTHFVCFVCLIFPLFFLLLPEDGRVMLKRHFNWWQKYRRHCFRKSLVLKRGKYLFTTDSNSIYLSLEIECCYAYLTFYC